MKRYLISALVIWVLASGLATGCGPAVQPSRPTPEPADGWSSHWVEALRLHRAGEFYRALVEYDKALELMPSDNSMIAHRAGINISKGEAYLMLFDGWQARSCNEQAGYFLDQATRYEKEDASWKIMAGQSLVIGSASFIYIADNKGRYLYQEAKQFLEQVRDLTGMPEVHYFLGIVNDKLGRRPDAEREFKIFLEAPDILVTLTAKDIMRQRARGWLQQTGQ